MIELTIKLKVSNQQKINSAENETACIAELLYLIAQATQATNKN